MPSFFLFFLGKQKEEDAGGIGRIVFYGTTKNGLIQGGFRVTEQHLNSGLQGREGGIADIVRV